MRKVFYPDELEKKQILKGTKIGEDMFLADYLLKQISLGYINNKTKFEYPYELKIKGLQSVQFSNEDNSKFNRYWIVTKNIQSISKNMELQGLYCIDGIKLGVDTREMEISENGTLEDKKIQKLNSPSIVFSEILTKLYDDIGKHYKIFDRLKEIAGALAVAKYIYNNHYPIDYNLVEKIYNSTLIPNYKVKVRSIYHCDENIYEENKILNLKESVKQYLLDNKMEINKDNVRMAKNYIKTNNIKYTLKRKNSFKKYVFGGIDLWTGIIENEKNILDDSFNSISTFDDEESYTNLISIKNNRINIDLKDCNTFEFPFLVKKKCSICNNELNVLEMKINQKFKNIYKTENIQYCIEHNPFKCRKCNTILLGKYLTIEGVNYHQECLKCKYCNKKLKENIIKFQDGFIHKKCLKVYKNDLIEKELIKFNENCPNCEFCDEKITDKFFLISNYKLHIKCLEKIKKKGDVDERKKYIFEGISRCYICKKIIFGEGLKTNNGLSHKECLSFIMFIIYAYIDMLIKNIKYYK